MSDNQDILNSTVNLYISAFNSYQSQFLHWGEWFFYTAVIITIVWICLWRAFDQNSFQESMPGFIKEFFILALFYTIMINSSQWLQSIADSVGIMGTTIAHFKVSPSDLIEHGIALGNVLLKPAHVSGLLDKIIGALICAFAYAVVLFVFIYVAIDVALTTIAIAFFISISGFLLAFSAFQFTRSVARKTLDLVIAQSFKLLTLYVVVAAGSNIFTTVTQLIGSGQSTFDIYGWAVAASVLFWSVSKYLPGQSARILSDVIQEHRGAAEAAALAMTATQVAKVTAAPVAGAALGAAGNLTKIAGSGLANTAAHFNKASMTPGSSGSSSLSSALGSGAKDFKSAAKEALTDHFKNLASKMTGGQGAQQPIKGIAQRMHESAQDVKSSYSKLPKSKPTGSTGNPSSAGRKAAGPSSTRNNPTQSGVSRPRK